MDGSVKSLEALGASSGKSAPPLSRLTLVAGIGAAVYFLFHCLVVITGPERRVMAWLYDDSFYYIVLAKHFSETHMSSFDGVTLTTGYHPLWMWLCALVYGTRHHLDLTYVRLCMGLSTAITTIVVCVALTKSVQRRAAGAICALAVALTSYSALNNGLTVMEWPLVILFSAALYWHLANSAAFTDDGNAASLWPALLLAFVLGLGGSISRTDFGLIPAAYLAGGLVTQRWFGGWRRVKGAFAALLGAVAGVALVSVYNYAMTHSFLQESAHVKRRFASLTSPFNPVPAVWQFARALFYLPPLDLSSDQRKLAVRIGLLFVVLVCLPLVVLLVTYRRQLARTFRQAVFSDAGELFTLTSAMLGIVGYICVYALNAPETFGWYSATVTVFIVVLVAKIFSLIPRRLRESLVLLLIVLNVLGASAGGNARAEYGENISAKILHRDHPTATLGGGDTGKPSFYNNGTMINLDGLMNNEVVPYLLNGSFPCYALHRHIEYMSDIGTVTVPLVDAVRRQKNAPPVPWEVYFPRQWGTDAEGESTFYVKTNFDAIRSSGECSGSLR